MSEPTEAMWRRRRIALVMDKIGMRERAIRTVHYIQLQILASDPLDAAFSEPGWISMRGYAVADANRRRLLLWRDALRAEIERLSMDIHRHVKTDRTSGGRRHAFTAAGFHVLDENRRS